jgi:hypothetical protein
LRDKLEIERRRQRGKPRPSGGVVGYEAKVGPFFHIRQSISLDAERVEGLALRIP